MNRVALVVGIPTYQCAHFRSVMQAPRSADKVAKILENYGEFQVERLPKTPELNKMSGGDVTYEQLNEALGTFLNQAVNKDGLIYFIGHGFTLERKLGIEEIKDGFLAPSDCQIEVQSEKIVNQARGFPLSDLNRLIKQYPLKSLIVCFDSCYSGLFLESVKSTLTETFISNKDYYLIAACQDSETAKIFVDDQYSLFSGLLINGLSEQNADNNGEISSDRLFDFICQQIKKIEENEHNKLQSPSRLGLGERIILVRYKPHQQIKTAIESNGELICPYQGLQPFKEAQQVFFFGRDQQVQEILQKLNKKPFVAVIGASGSGKSSVVRAGLIPWVRKNGGLIPWLGKDSAWQILEPIQPGIRPLENLINYFKKFLNYPKELQEFKASNESLPESLVSTLISLLGSGSYLLLIDQFEELFTVCADETERSRFIELITQVVNSPESRLTVVITMRADFLEPCLRYPSLTELIQTQSIYIPPLVDKDLEEAIIKPAIIQGYRFGEGLLGAILQDVGTEKGILPLLQFALTQLWEKRDRQNHQLTLEQYQVLGRVAGTLNKHAEKIYTYQDFGEEMPQQGRSSQEQEWIKLIFLRLVQIGEGGKDARQRQPKVRLLDMAGNNPEERKTLSQVLEDLVKGRLLVTGEEGHKTDEQNENTSANLAQEAQVIDLAHEALILHWTRLKAWLKENRDHLKFSQTITQEAQNWKNYQEKNEDNEEEESYLLLHGSRLVFAEELSKLKGFLSPLEVKYVATCVNRRDGELKAEVEQERQRRKVAEQRTLLAITSSIGITLISIFAGIQWRAADRGQIQALVTSSKATFNSNRDTLAALSEALKAGKQFQQSIWLGNDSQLRAEVMEVLAEATYWVRERNDWEAHNTYVKSVRFSPDRQPKDQIIATAGDDKLVKLWNLNGTEIKTKTQLKHNDSVIDLSFSPDGQMLASASLDGIVKLWKRDGTFLRDLNKRIAYQQGAPFRVLSVRFSPDGQTIATASEDGRIILWDRLGNPQKTWKGHNQGIYSISFSPDGQTIATASRDATVKFWNREGQSVRPPLVGHTGAVVQVQFSPDGQTIATVSADHTAILWDSKTEKKITLAGHTGDVVDVVFSPDSKTVATASTDTNIKLWNRNGELLSTLEGHKDRVNSLSFNRDGTLLASASYDKTVKLWQPNYSYLIPIKHPSQVRVVNFSPDGQNLVTADIKNNVSLWKPNGDILQKWTEDSSVWDVSFSQDSRIVAAAKQDGTVTLRDLEGKPLHTLSKHNGLVASVSFSPDGKTIATAGYEPIVKFWNLEGQLKDTLNTDEKRVYSARFSPDGSTIATTSEDGTAKLWNRDRTFRVLLEGHKPDSPIFNVSFSPDSRLLATASKDNNAIIWNQNGKLLHRLEGHTADVLSVEFKPDDGQTLATASDDRTVKLWTQNGRLITTLNGHLNYVNRLHFSPDGKILATASSDKTVLLWKEMDNLTLDGLMKRGCNWMQDYRKTHPDKLPNVCDGIQP